MALVLFSGPAVIVTDPTSRSVTWTSAVLAPAGTKTVGGTCARVRSALFGGLDAPQRGVPQLVAIGREHFDEAALPVGPPHHGASGEAAWSQSLHRVSCVAARVTRRRSRCSVTIASTAAASTKTVHSDAISNRASAKTQGAINHFRTGK